MEDEEEMVPRFATDLVMCSTCSSFVMKKRRKAITKLDPDKEVVEVVRDAQKMRDLMQAIFLHGPFQEKEPASATKEQWQVLRRRRLIMMETKRCPACYRSLLNACPTCSRPMEKPGPDEEDKAAGSKEKKNSLREKGSESMAVLSQGGMERKKIATEDEAMLANARPVKRSREERKRSSSGLKQKKKKEKSEDNGSCGSDGLKKKKANSEDKGGSGSEKKTKRSSETEGSGSKEAGTGLGEKSEDISLSALQNLKTKMVTRRIYKKCIDLMRNDHPAKPYSYTTDDPLLDCLYDSRITQYEAAQYEASCEFHEYLRRQSFIRGYAEYQIEVTDDEDE